MSKEKAPAFQFYAAEYLTDEKVVVMNSSEEGHYIRAIAYCWREGSIPADSERLKKLLGKLCTDDEARVVQGCFKQHPTESDRLVHPRLEIEREKQAAWRAKSAEGGRRSAEARTNQGLNKGKGGSRVVQPNANSSSTSSSSSTNLFLGSKKIDDLISLVPNPKARQAIEAWVTWKLEERKEKVTAGGLCQTLKRYEKNWDQLISDVRFSMSSELGSIRTEWKKKEATGRVQPEFYKPKPPIRASSGPQKIGVVLQALTAAKK